MYEATEKLDANHMAQYFGGDKDDWDVIKDAGRPGRLDAIDGTMLAWNEMLELASVVSQADTSEAKTSGFYRLQGLNADGANNPDRESYLDVDSYIDYLIVTMYTRSGGWPNENFVMARRRGSESTGFKFLMWDNEFSLDAGWLRSISRLGSTGPAAILAALKDTEDFRVRFGDRMQRLLEPGGALYVSAEAPNWNPLQPENNRPASVYAQLVDQVRSPLVPESARWDTRFSVNGSFQRDVDANLRRFRTATLVNDIAKNDLYREAPRFKTVTGIIPAAAKIEITANSGRAYYTLDGTDPRETDGSISANAHLYEEPIRAFDGTVIHTRSLEGAKWSALSSRVSDVVPFDSDITGDGVTDIVDVDAVCMAIRTGDQSGDLNLDGHVSVDDVGILLELGLHTTFGDANLDGIFNSTDLVLVFSAAEYEDGVDGNSSWAEGDWNCDGDLSSRDLVQAFQKGGYA